MAPWRTDHGEVPCKSTKNNSEGTVLLWAIYRSSRCCITGRNKHLTRLSFLLHGAPFFVNIEPSYLLTLSAHVPPRWSIIKISQKIFCSTQATIVTLNAIKLNRLYIRCFLRHEIFDSIPRTWNLETLLKSNDSLDSDSRSFPLLSASLIIWLNQPDRRPSVKSRAST